MTLRRALGGGARGVHELVDQLLDREDSLIVLVDGDRVISYGGGFGLSPCQLELVVTEIERTVRSVGDRARHRGSLAGGPSSNANGRFEQTGCSKAE